MTKLLNTKQAAAYLNISAAFLERDRWAGAKIPFIRIGTRSIRYRITDLDNFIENRLRLSTCDEGTSHA